MAKHIRLRTKEYTARRVKELIDRLRWQGVSAEEIRAQIRSLFEEAYAEVVVAQTLAGMSNASQIPPAHLLIDPLKEIMFVEGRRIVVMKDGIPYSVDGKRSSIPKGGHAYRKCGNYVVKLCRETGKGKCMKVFRKESFVVNDDFSVNTGDCIVSFENVTSVCDVLAQIQTL